MTEARSGDYWLKGMGLPDDEPTALELRQCRPRHLTVLMEIFRDSPFSAQKYVVEVEDTRDHRKYVAQYLISDVLSLPSGVLPDTYIQGIWRGLLQKALEGMGGGLWVDVYWHALRVKGGFIPPSQINL